MAKQKIVVKVAMHNEKKARKALKIAVGVSGVESASFQGTDKDEIAVTGEGIDSVKLTTLLRKGVGHTSIVSVGLEEKKEKKKEEDDETNPTIVPMQFHPYQYYYGYGIPHYYVY